MHVIDRRRNPKSKSLGNRQRFVRAFKSHIRKAVNDSIRQRQIADLEGGEKSRSTPKISASRLLAMTASRQP